MWLRPFGSVSRTGSPGISGPRRGLVMAGYTPAKAWSTSRAASTP